jgi:hypothetical protein
VTAPARESIPRPPTARRNDPLRWSEQGLNFEITSPDARALDAAERVLAIRPQEFHGVPHRRWHVEGSPSRAREWRLTGGSTTDTLIPVISETRDGTFAHLEHDVLTYCIRAGSATAAVHAALLSKDGCGVMIAGPSFAGKSTLATALWMAGWSLMADDIAFIDSASGTASPARRRVSLRFESRDLVGEALWSRIASTPSCARTWKGLCFHPHELSGEERQRETRLSAIVFLARRNVRIGPAECARITPANAAVALVPYALDIRALPLIESVAKLAPALERARAYDIGRGPLAAMVSAVESCVA